MTSYTSSVSRRTVLKMLGGTAVKGGRDADSITCNSAAWLGALAGNGVWPQRWRQTVQKANIHRMDLQQTAKDLIDKGLNDRTVAPSAM